MHFAPKGFVLLQEEKTSEEIISSNYGRENAEERTKKKNKKERE